MRKSLVRKLLLSFLVSAPVFLNTSCTQEDSKPSLEQKRELYKEPPGDSNSWEEINLADCIDPKTYNPKEGTLAYLDLETGNLISHQKFPKVKKMSQIKKLFQDLYGQGYDAVFLLSGEKKETEFLFALEEEEVTQAFITFEKNPSISGQKDVEKYQQETKKIEKDYFVPYVVGLRRIVKTNEGDYYAFFYEQQEKTHCSPRIKIKKISK